MNQKNAYLAHALPLILEIICLITVGFYGQFYYKETLIETETLLALMLFAMGLQNGLTASISNFAVKTTHLTGTTTDLGILFSMFTKAEYRNNEALKGKARLLLSIAASYLFGAILSGFTYMHLGFKMFYAVSLVLVVVIMYDLYKLRVKRFFIQRNARRLNIENLGSYIKLNREKEESIAS